ncbi:MAG TPA: DUF1579 domain-containing protein [Phycisphaerales bacterium]|nr:DUF1579 domain-containing protein [Phycisphaerales bacterium]
MKVNGLMAMAGVAVMAMAAGLAAQPERNQPPRDHPAPAKPAAPAKPGQPDRPGMPERPAQPDKPGMPDMPEMGPDEMAWMKAAMPGREHEMLAKGVGTWDAQATFWMQPGAPPMESAGTAVMTMELDGRWLKQEYTSSFMNMPFRGIGYTGYDNIKKKYVSTWMDTMSTSMMASEGTFDPATNTYHYTGSFQDPMGKNWKFRHTLKIESDDRVVFEMHQGGEGVPEHLAGRIVYTRKGGAATPAKMNATPGGGTPAQPGRN